MLALRMNTRNLAITQFTNYDFNSFCVFNGKLYAASATGIYELDSAQKDGTSAISAFFEFYVGDIGAINLKRIRALHFAGEMNGSMEVTVEEDDDTATSKTYDITTAKTSNEQHGIRVFVDRTHKGRFWKLTVSNVNGSDFSVDSVHVTWNILAGTKQGGS